MVLDTIRKDNYKLVYDLKVQLWVRTTSSCTNWNRTGIHARNRTLWCRSTIPSMIPGTIAMELYWKSYLESQVVVQGAIQSAIPGTIVPGIVPGIVLLH